MSGYSGTPLIKKLGIKSDSRVLLVDVRAEVRSQLRAPLAQCRLVKELQEPLDFVLVFVKSRLELGR